MTRKLPVGTCIRHALSSVRSNLFYAFRISWPWYLTLLLLGVGAFAVLNRSLAGDGIVAFLLTFLVLSLAVLLAFSSIAVNWHRYILLDELSDGSDIFRLDEKTWRYFGNALLVILAGSGVSILASHAFRLVLGSAVAGAAVEFIASLVVMFVTGVISYRLSVKLPAIALGRRDFRFLQAWEMTRDNNLQLLAIFLIQLGAYLLVFFFLYLLVSLHPLLGIVALIAYLAFLWLFSIFSITILTSLYGFFIEGRDF